jgi:hypothetical protein
MRKKFYSILLLFLLISCLAVLPACTEIKAQNIKHSNLKNHTNVSKGIKRDYYKK